MKEDFSRLKRMLDEAREDLSAESKTVALRDFMRVAEEYYQTDGDGTLVVKEERGKRVLIFSVSVREAKNFLLLK